MIALFYSAYFFWILRTQTSPFGIVVLKVTSRSPTLTLPSSPTSYQCSFSSISKPSRFMSSGGPLGRSMFFSRTTTGRPDPATRLLIDDKNDEWRSLTKGGFGAFRSPCFWRWGRGRRLSLKGRWPQHVRKMMAYHVTRNGFEGDGLKIQFKSFRQPKFRQLSHTWSQ